MVAAMTEKKTTWSPTFAPHVVGTFGERKLDDDGNPEPQRIEMVCNVCKATHRYDCTSGAVRSRISSFAASHIRCKR